jgi:hypothetical protein
VPSHPDPLAEQFAALANPVDDSDWLDVRRRARGKSRRALVLPLVAVVAVLAVASAFALERHLVDFFAAEPAPERVVLHFEQLEARSVAFHGAGPAPISGEARKVLEATIDGERRSLFVAPTEDGGFCWVVPELQGSCGRTGHRRTAPTLGVVWLEGERGPALLSGHVLDQGVERLELAFEDGSREDVPLAWVSAPIDAGFYVFEVARRHLSEGERAQELVALARDGDVLARHRFTYSDPAFEPGPDGLSHDADRARKRVLFSFDDHRGKRWTLVTAPAPGGRLCYAHNGGGGCVSHRFPPTIDGMGIQGGGEWAIVCCAVSDDVATVELRYQDGTRTTLRPVGGFLLHVIAPEHYVRGRRLREIAWRDASGRQLARRVVRADVRGVYPCARKDEVDVGAGVRVCP